MLLSKNGKSALSIVKKYHPNVSHVVDANADITVSVSPADCKGARKKSASGCAMARACRREYDGAIISLSTAYIIKGEKAMRFKVPTRVAREIVSFDRHHDFAPGEYQLKAPRGMNCLGAGRQPTATGVRNGRETKRRRHFTQGIREL